MLPPQLSKWVYFKVFTLDSQGSQSIWPTLLTARRANRFTRLPSHEGVIWHVSQSPKNSDNHSLEKRSILNDFPPYLHLIHVINVIWPISQNSDNYIKETSCRSWPVVVTMSTDLPQDVGLTISRNHATFLTLYVLFFLRKNINIYSHFMSFFHTNETQVVEIPPRVRQGPAYSTLSISWLLMSWRRKEPGHQQPWYWPS